MRRLIAESVTRFISLLCRIKLLSWQKVVYVEVSCSNRSRVFRPASDVRSQAEWCRQYRRRVISPWYSNAKKLMRYVGSRVGISGRGWACYARKGVKTPRKTATCCVFQGRRTVHYTSCARLRRCRTRVSKVLKQQSSCEGAGLGTYCATSLFWIGDPLPVTAILPLLSI